MNYKQYMKFGASSSKIPKGTASITVKIYQYSTEPESAWHIDIQEEAQLGRHTHRDSKQNVTDVYDIHKLPKIQISTALIGMMLPRLNEYEKVSFQLNAEKLEQCILPITTDDFRNFIAMCDQKTQEALDELHSKYTHSMSMSSYQ